MDIKVRGKFEGRHVKVVWSDGHLTGDPIARAELIVYASDKDGYILGHPVGPGSSRNHLATPEGFYFVCMDVLEDPTFEGYTLPVVNVPPGARR